MAKIADPPRPAPEGHLRPAEADLGQEETGVVKAAAAEKAAESRGGEMTGKETAPGGDGNRPRPGEMEIQLDVMAELSQDTERTSETIPGRLLVD